jgi:hypothetical protein
MKVNFQIVHDSENIDEMLFDAMKEAYENLYIEKSDDVLKSFYEIKYDFQLRNSKSIAGFEIEVEEISAEDYDTFLKNIAGKIKDDEHIFALVKFHDETRFESYLNYFREIAELEMQLREILSCIFYYEYSEDFYNLLEEYEVNFPKDTPQQEVLQERLENQFFYLTFSNYLTLDKPKEIRQAKDINTILESSDSYEDFRNKICNRGIKDEKHLDFLAAIKQDLQTIESVRNAVAHNRAISSTKLGHYETATGHLLEKFQEYWIDSEELGSNK